MSVEGLTPLARFSDISCLDRNALIDQPRLQCQQDEGFPDPTEMLNDGILKLPVELVLKIFRNLDLCSAFRTSETCKKLHGVFKAHHETLALAILAEELSPFDNLLQCIVQKGEDLAVPLGPCLRRRIYHRGKLVSEGETPAPGDEAHKLLPPVSLDQEHFRRLVAAHHLVKDWEQLYPQYRFGRCATECRELRPHEKERLRGALYQWMSYAQYFHGDFKRPSRLIPRARSTDIRCRKLRVLSNVELIELEDLWDTVVSIVACHICPSTEQVMMENDGSLSLHDAERLSFGSAESVFPRRPLAWHENTFTVNGAIVETFLKLLPGDILHLATSRFVYTRDKVIREVRLSYPSILEDQQTFGHALAAVRAERCEANWAARGIWTQLRVSESTSRGGILDILDPDIWPGDSTFRETLDTPGERALSWQPGDHETNFHGNHRVVEKGRLEP